MSLRDRWNGAARLVAESRDVLDARPAHGEPPPALVTRGWAAFLRALGDEQLAEIEISGQGARWPDHTPPSLRALVEQAREVCALPSLSTPNAALGAPTPRRHETPRKGTQIDAFARLILPLAAHAHRVIDVGSGHGHLTREIAERIALPVVGLERDPALAGRARSLSASRSATFAETDVLRDGLPLSNGDCVIGLHACGELGDAMVTSVARCDAALALVGCCLQKRRAPSRRPLCAEPELGEALDLPRDLLGLSNLTARDEGVEATRAENLAARERRLALYRLLSEHVGPLRLGAELDGLNRRAAHGDLSVLVGRAFALRHRPAPSRGAIDEAAAWARAEHAGARRLSLPRAMLARALEVFVLLDRALYLEERGFAVELGPLFPEAASARNLALIASRRSAT